jgi:hypothetical protein
VGAVDRVIGKTVGIQNTIEAGASKRIGTDLLLLVARKITARN